MIYLEVLCVLLAIYFGARMGGVAIGFAGALGVAVLTLGFGLDAGEVPVDVILIIMSVIAAISAMQLAGGMDWLVAMTERLLRKHPRRITFLAPCVTYVMTLVAGTGHTAFSTLPVIAEVSKEQDVRPSRPLSIAVVASQIAITASPISAAVVYLSVLLEPMGVGYLQLLLALIPTSFAACMVGAWVASKMGVELSEDRVYQERLNGGLIHSAGEVKEAPQGALASVVIFVITVVLIVIYATLVSDKLGLIADPPLNRNEAIMVLMMSAAAVILLVTKPAVQEFTSQSTFKSGMSACVCVLGVAWLGDTFVSNHSEEIKQFAGGVLTAYPWLLALTLFFGSMLLYSQAATAKALLPMALALGMMPLDIIASFVAVSALFVLPTYPTLLAAIEMDSTGSTRIGKWVVNHPFFLPGMVSIVTAVLLTYLWAGVIL